LLELIVDDDSVTGFAEGAGDESSPEGPVDEEGVGLS
jgi:hypothetical protein